MTRLRATQGHRDLGAGHVVAKRVPDPHDRIVLQLLPLTAGDSGCVRMASAASGPTDSVIVPDVTDPSGADSKRRV